MALPLADRRLTTPEALKEVLGIPPADTSADGRLARAIDAATGQIEDYLGRPLAAEEVTEQPYLGASGALMLSRRPVLEVLAFTAGGVAIAPDSYRLESEAGLIRGARAWWGPHYAAEASITYRAGYVLTPPEERTLPPQIEAVCIALAAAIFRDTGRDLSIRSDTTEGVGTTTYHAAGPINAELVLGALSPWRELRV